jgi:thiol:disulfide interchange protein
VGRLAGILALFAQLAGSCRDLMAPAVHWDHDVASARLAAASEHKPVVLFFGASWDVATAEMKRETLVDPDVRTLLHDDFVAAEIDCTDEDDPQVEGSKRLYAITGTPQIVILAPDFRTERRRITEFVPPSTLAAVLRAAR